MSTKSKTLVKHFHPSTFYQANWIGHILRRNCLLQRVTEGKIQGGIEVTGRQGRRRRKLLHDLKERTGYSHLKKEALDRTMWRARFGRGFGPVVRQTTKWMNECKQLMNLLSVSLIALLRRWRQRIPLKLWLYSTYHKSLSPNSSIVSIVVIKRCKSLTS